MQPQLTPKRMLLGCAVGLVFGTWNLAHGHSDGAQGIVVAAAMGLMVLAGVFSTLRGKQPQGTGTPDESHSPWHQLLDKILVFFVVAAVCSLIFLALPDVR